MDVETFSNFLSRAHLVIHSDHCVSIQPCLGFSPSNLNSVLSQQFIDGRFTTAKPLCEFDGGGFAGLIGRDHLFDVSLGKLSAIWLFQTFYCYFPKHINFSVVPLRIICYNKRSGLTEVFRGLDDLDFLANNSVVLVWVRLC